MVENVRAWKPTKVGRHDAPLEVDNEKPKTKKEKTEE